MSERRAPPPPGHAPASTRFFKTAAVEESELGFLVALDGRRAMTPARAPLALPTCALAEAVATEWNAQGAQIAPGTMPLTKLANTAIDGVAKETRAVQEDLLRYAGSDLVVYRAGAPEALVAAQVAAWDPVLDWARETLGVRFVLREGVMFVEQPPDTLAALAETIRAETSPFVLAALHVMTTLTGSLLLTLMHASGSLAAGEAWRAAHVDEIHQESFWGQDLEAVQRRTAREAEFGAASRFYDLAKAS